MLIILASLKTIPQELFEAARIDGASEWVIAWRVNRVSAARLAIELLDRCMAPLPADEV